MLTKKNACLVFENGEIMKGYGYGATGLSVAELCFNTSMFGYQEVISDPSYADQIILFGKKLDQKIDDEWAQIQLQVLHARRQREHHSDFRLPPSRVHVAQKPSDSHFYSAILAGTGDNSLIVALVYKESLINMYRRVLQLFCCRLTGKSPALTDNVYAN